MSISPTPELFEQLLYRHLGFDPTDGQRRLFYAFTRLMFAAKSHCALMIKGYAGTGKTTSVSAMVRALGEQGVGVCLLAPTGRAAKVLSGYSGLPASTIHRQIYMRRSDKSGRSWFELRENKLDDTVFFIDEASMISSGAGDFQVDEMGSGDILQDVMTYVFSAKGSRLVIIGDDAQLPPVGSAESPALDRDFLRDRFSLNIAVVSLTEVIRQQQDSGILFNATRLRERITAAENGFPTFVAEGYPDVVRVNSDPQPFVEEAMGRYGKEGFIVLTRSNKRANQFNQQIRFRLLGYEEEINSGDRMMVLKNNYDWTEEPGLNPSGFIANGDIIDIVRVRKYVEKGAFRFCLASIRMADYEDSRESEVWLLCNSIWEESANLGREKLKELWAEIEKDYEDIENAAKRRKAVKEDPFYNALQVKFAYAITVHKAQGGQWPAVFVDPGFLTDEMAGTELNRWFYTAITRAQKELYLMGFSDQLITAG